MELLKSSSVTVTENEYVIQHPKEGVIYYKEFINDKGKVIDSFCRTKNGYEIDDPIIVGEIWEFVDEIERMRTGRPFDDSDSSMLYGTDIN